MIIRNKKMKIKKGRGKLNASCIFGIAFFCGVRLDGQWHSGERWRVDSDNQKPVDKNSRLRRSFLRLSGRQVSFNTSYGTKIESVVTDRLLVPPLF